MRRASPGSFAAVTLAGAVFALAAAAFAQPLMRLKGKVVAEAGAPIEADVRIEAVSGPRGDAFVGQRVFTSRSNARGEWTLIGIKAGAWMFAATVDGQLPDAIVLPINVFVPAGQGMAGISPSWQPVLKPAPIPEGAAGEWLSTGIAAVLSGDAARLSDIMTQLPAGADALTLAAAGRICLLGRNASLARALFLRALAQDPRSFRARLGVGSASLMLADFSAASKAFKEARELTPDKDERSYLTAAIADLNRMDISG